MEKMIGNYELESTEPVEEAGVIKYYKARDLKDNRTVMLGILKDEYSNDADMVRKFREYFLNLFQKVKKAANLAEVFNIVGDTGHKVYTVQEYVEGKNLVEYLQNNPSVTYDEFIPIFKQICEGLYNLHKRDICHYSVQPKNIVISSDNRVKIIGCGNLYLALGNKHLIESLVRDINEFIAPEILNGDGKDQITKTCDIYSLGKLIQSLPIPIDNTFLQLMLEIDPASRIQSSRELGERSDQLFIRQKLEIPDDKPKADPKVDQSAVDADCEVIRLTEEKLKPNQPNPFMYKLSDIPINAEVKIISEPLAYSMFNRQTCEFSWKPGPEHKGKHLVQFEVSSDSGKKRYELPIEVKFGIGVRTDKEKKQSTPESEPNLKPKHEIEEKPDILPSPKTEQKQKISPRTEQKTPPYKKPGPEVIPKSEQKPMLKEGSLNFKNLSLVFLWKYNLILFIASIIGIFLFLPDLLIGCSALVLLESVFLLFATANQRFVDGLRE